MSNYFNELNTIDVQDKIEKKNGLSYLSWAWAWGELKKRHPDATYTVYENKDEVNYFTDGKTAWVKTGVTVNGIEHIEYLPVMDYKNKSIPLENITSFNVNTAIQRSLTKAVARHGLGLYIYAGEDLPEQETQTVESIKNIKPKTKKTTTKETTTKETKEENFMDGLEPDAKSIEEIVEECTTEDALEEVYKTFKETIVNNQDLLTKVIAKGKKLKKAA